MKQAIELALKYSKESIECDAPFIVTLRVEEHCRYQLSGCNIPDGSIRIEVVYLEKHKEQAELLDFCDENDSVDEIELRLAKLIEDREEWFKDSKNLSHLTGLTKSDILASANEAKVKLLDKVLERVDLDCFAWAFNIYKDIDNAAQDRLSKI